MKKLGIILLVLNLAITQSSWAQKEEVEQLILNWEKLKQFEEILDNMYRGYKILDKGYRTIKDIAQGNYSIH
jgi:hypothetical protein